MLETSKALRFFECCCKINALVRIQCGQKFQREKICLTEKTIGFCSICKYTKLDVKYSHTDMALKTKGRPAILLFEMLKLTSFSPTAVIMSERQVEEAALRDDAVDGWRIRNG